jgi:hypothetical protein
VPLVRVPDLPSLVPDLAPVVRTTYHQRPDDGQWFARDEGEDRYTHEHFVYWRPVYPDAPRVDLRRVVKEETGYVPPPPPRLPATPVDPQHPVVPAKARKALETALSHGWRADLRRAMSATGTSYLCVRAAKPGRRVAFLWRWRPERLGTLKGAPHTFPAEWENDNAWTGVYVPATHTAAMKELAT